jgi:hypothetical protein
VNLTDQHLSLSAGHDATDPNVAAFYVVYQLSF